MLLEAKDYEGNWYSAMIKSIKDGKARVVFEGWYEGNNEWIPIDDLNRFRPHQGNASKRGRSKVCFFERRGSSYMYRCDHTKKLHLLTLATLNEVDEN